MVLQPNPTHLPLDPASMCHALETAYNGNKSSGPSLLLTQFVKHLNTNNVQELSEVFHAIAQMSIP